MNEARRFMRYVLPGLACIVELIIALLVSDGPKLPGILKVGGTNFSSIVGTFLASGAIGYILANIYFGIYWVVPNCFLIIDHRDAFHQISGDLEIVMGDEKPIKIEELSKRDAWAILTENFRTESAGLRELKQLQYFLDRLVDITHGLGATEIGTLFSGFAWAWLHFLELKTPADLCKIIIIVLAWIFLLAAYAINWVRTQQNLRIISNSMWIKLIKQKRGTVTGKIKLYYSCGKKSL